MSELLKFQVYIYQLYIIVRVLTLVTTDSDSED